MEKKSQYFLIEVGVVKKKKKSHKLLCLARFSCRVLVQRLDTSLVISDSFFLIFKKLT